ncbi:hypothetical protein GBAR_LOCUS14940 [Geodia barretti]|uniref:Bacteriophage T5 Orf172 DNA-binding domain-containing protein n=1 Tax=Geodia barretti TaxID=519541 RepID=A0AA35SA20_GEOBA|nr:hypothetical protein GBAR_LOCUS14940 [Geodia barretti]
MAEEEFKYKTPEEIAALPVFPEPEQTDGGSFLGDGQGYVYFITESGNTNYFKVGKTVDPNTRRMNLQTGSPRRLDMSPVCVSSMASAEARVLQVMRENYQSTDGGTEWFYGNVAQAKRLFMSTV